MPETPQDRIHVVRLGEDPAPASIDQPLAVARLDVAVPPPPAGFGDSSTGLLVPVSPTGLLRGVPLRQGEEVQGGLVISPKETSQVTDEAVLAGLAAEKQNDQFRVSASEINFDPSGAILVKYLRQAIERRRYEEDRSREIILENLPDEPDIVMYQATSFKRKSRQVASHGQMREVTSPGSAEEVMIAAMDVVHALVSPSVFEATEHESPRDRQKATVKVMRRMHAMLKTGAIQLQGSGETLAEMPDFTQACVDVLLASDMIQFPDARKLIYDMVEYVALPDSQKPKYLELLDYYADLDHPLAFSLTIDEAIHHPDSEWVLLQKDRIKKLVEVLNGSPQDLFDNFDRLRDLAKGIVFIGPPLLNITGKVGWEIEFKAQRHIACPERTSLHNEGTVVELTRSDYRSPDPQDLVYNGGYLEDLVGVRRFLLNSTRHEPASFHAHVDFHQHPVEPSIGDLLGEGALEETVVRGRKGLETYEIRGLFPPILADGTIDPAMLADVFTFYSQVALANQESHGALELRAGQEDRYSVEQLIFGHVVNFVENPLARLALLHVLQRDMQRTALLHRADPNARHFSVFEAINPLKVALSYDLSHLDVLTKVFSQGERQTLYIQNRVLLLDIVQRNRMRDSQTWATALEEGPAAIIGRLGKDTLQYRDELLQFVRSGDGELVKPAVDCLAQDAQTVGLLLPVLGEDFGPETIYLQSEILDSIHQYVSPSEFSRLYKSFFISHSSEAVRTRAFRYLIDDPNQKEYLYTLLDEPSFSYENVAKILRSLDKEDLPHVGPRVEQIFHRSMYDEVRSSAIRLLAKDFDTYGDLLMNVLMDEIKKPHGGGEYIISDVVGVMAHDTKHLEFLANIIHTEQKVNGQVTSNYGYAEDAIVYGLVDMARRNFNLTDDEKNILMDIAKTVLKRHRRIEALDLIEKVLVGATEDEIERFATFLELGTGTWDTRTEGDLRFRFNRYNF